VRLGESLRVRRDHACEAVQRERSGVLVNRRRLRSGRSGVRVVTGVPRVAPEHQREETQDSDSDPEQQGGSLENAPESVST
jgi:hypothetical protein